MARGRMISKSLGSSRKYHDLLRVAGKLGEFCQMLFPLIVVNTDDYGRMPGDAFTVKNVVLPSSGRLEADFDRALNALHTVGLIVRYVASDDSGGSNIYLQVTNFDAHQTNLHKRPGISQFPPVPEDPGEGRMIRPNLTELNLTELKRTEQNPTAALAVGERRTADALFETFYAAYPKKKAKDAARKAWDKRRPDNELLTVILRALERQKVSPDWQKDSGRYIPFPATWLNSARWTDVVEVELDPAGLLVSDKTRQNIAHQEEALKLIAGNSYGHRG